MNLRDYRSIVDSAEYIFVTVPLEEERQRKNAIISNQVRLMSNSEKTQR